MKFVNTEASSPSNLDSNKNDTTLKFQIDPVELGSVGRRWKLKQLDLGFDDAAK